MLTTFDREQWKEDLTQVHVRSNFDIHTDPAVVRQHYPLMARAKKSLMMYGIPEGKLITFARTRLEPQFYPIEAITGIGDGGTHTRRLYLSSDDVELLEI